MTLNTKRQLFAGKILNGVTQYIDVPIREGTIGIHIGWLDATSSAAITLELSSIDEAQLTSTVAWHWKDSAVSITGPTATAAGATSLNVENVRQDKARLKIVAAANCDFDIRNGWPA